MTKPSVSIRLGAAYDTVTVDGVEFDQSTMTREERKKLRVLLINGLIKARSIRLPRRRRPRPSSRTNHPNRRK